MDECTGGNVLATNSSKKSCFFYIAVKQLAHLQSADCWFPHSMVPSRDVTDVAGGVSSVTASIVRHLHLQRQEGVSINGVRYTLNLQLYIGDYDSVARVFLSKGASGLHCCALCANVVAAWSDVPSFDGHFLTISSDEVEHFQVYDPTELYAVHDELQSQINNMTKAQKQEKETQFGFGIHEQSLLSCQTSRTLLSIDKVVYDSHHLYFANGVAAQEILLLQKQLASDLHLELSRIQESVCEVPWACNNSSFSSVSGRKHLFHPSLWRGVFFKGSATAVWYLMPLLWYYAFVFGKDLLSDALKCFSALMDAACH